MTSLRDLNEAVAVVRKAVAAGIMTIRQVVDVDTAKAARLEYLRKWWAEKHPPKGTYRWPEPYRSLPRQIKTKLAMQRARAEKRGEPTELFPPRIRKRRKNQERQEPS